METTDAIKKYKIIPQVYFTGEDRILPTIGALCSGGLPLICIVMNGCVTKKTLTLAVNTFPDTCIGARASDAAQARLACSCGVNFVCSHFFSDEIFEICKSTQVRYIPGCFTPSETAKALNLGMDTVMFSPTYMLHDPSLIAKYISAFPGVKMIADCSGDTERLPDFASVPKLFGIVDGDITSGTLDEIAEKCKSAVRKYSDAQRY